MTPNAVVRGTYVFETAFGWVGIAWSAQGLVAVTLPEPSESEAWDELPPRSASATVPAANLDVELLARNLGLYFDGVNVTFDEALDPNVGTPFLRRVWGLTRLIPRGEVRTYGEIAREAGSPLAARAVGQAMTRNPWAVIVPCHRLVGSSGQLTGFGGGLPMKRRLLDMEGAFGSTRT
ncbi:methylated-DNA--[protein]-cysteine S-methyltransferase [Chloroflexota bacterium]